MHANLHLKIKLGPGLDENMCLHIHYQIIFGLCWLISGRVKCPDGTSQVCHGLFKSPIGKNSKWINETFSILNIIVKVIKANIFVSIKASTVTHPVPTKEFSYCAHSLQGHIGNTVELEKMLQGVFLCNFTTFLHFLFIDLDFLIRMGLLKKL